MTDRRSVQGESLRILVVDDDPPMVRTLVDILALAGHCVTPAHSGEDALEAVRNATFDFALTDVRMPGMTGIELSRQLHNVQPDLPVVLMTAYAEESLLQEGFVEGVLGVLDKPLDIENLLAFLKALGRDRTIALVDDDISFAQSLGDILQARGYHVQRITDPHVPLREITDDAHIVLLDIVLDGVVGTDLLRAIRQRVPDLPVILMTGHHDRMQAGFEAVNQGYAVVCLLKPIVIADLLNILHDLDRTRLRALISAGGRS